MKTNQAGIDLIKSFEALRLTAYKDGGGVWTIGWGHTETAHKGMTILKAEAEELFRQDLRNVEEAVDRLVETDVNANEYAALVSLVFNIGAKAFAGSALLRKLNIGNTEGAASEFRRWNKDNGKVVAGLVRRRTAEEALFRQAPKTLAGSRTIHGATASGVGTTGTMVTDLIQSTQDQISAITPYLETAKWVFIALAIAGIAYTIYARWDDHRKGRN